MSLKISYMRMNFRKPGETHTVKQHFRKELGNSLDVESISIATLLPDQSNIVFHDPSQTHTKSATNASFNLCISGVWKAQPILHVILVLCVCYSIFSRNSTSQELLNCLKLPYFNIKQPVYIMIAMQLSAIVVVAVF